MPSDQWTIGALQDQIDELEAELREVKADRDMWEAEALEGRAQAEEETFNVLVAVRDWFHDTVLFGKKPDAKQVMREVDQLVADLT